MRISDWSSDVCSSDLFTKTYAMAAAAILSITLVPVLMGWLIRGRIPAEQAHPINRWLTHAYRPALDWVLDRPQKALVIAALVFATSPWPMTQISGEFMPQLREGALLDMPPDLHGISAASPSRRTHQHLTEDRPGGKEWARRGRS